MENMQLHDIENYLYGMSFEEYLDYRFIRVSDRFTKFGSNIFDGVKFSRNVYRPRPKFKRGSFVEKYIKIKNRYNSETYKTLLNNKPKTVDIAYNNILKFQKSM